MSDQPLAAADALAPARPGATPSHPKYRPDIDGLRAIAVLSVVAFHVGFSPLHGGFVGVDIFFVISGYLITLIMYNQVQAGRFSILAFYERRIRRIFPALIAMLLVTSVVAYQELLPAEIRDYSYSLVATLFSAANIYFWANSGYFDTPSLTKPLLHTWSLAVEEQCYIILPILLQVVHRRRPNAVRPVIAGLAIVSLAISAVGAYTNPDSTFYLVHTRAWELLLGGLISLDMFPVPRGPALRNAMAAIGLAMIGFAIFVFSPATPFPGLTALVPCVGSGLIILAGRGGPSTVGRLLSLRPVVFFGLISYSLYLWHWPILVFQSTNAVLISATPRTGKIVVVAVSIVAATLSWALVERPFRKQAGSRRIVFGIAFASGAAVLAIAGLLAVLPSRFSQAAVNIGSYLNYDTTHMRDGACFISSKVVFADFDKALCVTPSPDRPNVLIIGDSHAAHLWYGMDAVLKDDHVMQATSSGCKPTLQAAAGNGRCDQMMDFLFHRYLPANPPDVLVISARWDVADLPAVDQTLVWAKQHDLNVVLLGPIMEYDSPLPRILAMSLQRHDPALVKTHETDKSGLDAQLAEIARRDHAGFVSLHTLLCPSNQCIEYAKPGIPIQFDYSHLTREGSILLAERLAAMDVFQPRADAATASRN